MERKIIKDLLSWFHREERKPLVLRGARQVGKTWLVRFLASKLGVDLIEINFERDPNLKTLFSENDPVNVILRLESFFNKEIIPSNTILFLDEIQAAPELLAKLRWFAEEKPELAVIAAGSLLDFALDRHEFSMPVGRINYMYLEPMTFEEFLLARNQKKLYEFLANFSLKDKIPEAIHERLWQFLREYIFVGGMPAAVNAWEKNKSFKEVGEIHQNILATYRDDFAKYAKRISIENLDAVFEAIPILLSKKFKYTQINRDARIESLKNALELLCKARVCHKVVSCAANGVPIGAEIKSNIFKVIFFDVGLVLASMGLSLEDVSKSVEQGLVNEGGIAEQLIGQQLRNIGPRYIDPKLYYWVREKEGSGSEVDYVIQENAKIIPVEVKAGKTGTLRSLHMFVGTKGFKKAVRFNADYPSITEVNVKDYAGKLIEYELISLPLYLAEQLNRFL